MSTVNNRYSIEPTQRAQSLDKSPNNSTVIALIQSSLIQYYTASWVG